MSEGQNGLSSAPPGSVFNLVCPAAREAGCSLRTAALEVTARRNGLKESLSACEAEIFLSLAAGHQVAVRDHETRALWRGRVDMPFPDHGFVWVITDTGERKLLDIGVHTIWLPEESGACGSVHRDTSHLGSPKMSWVRAV